jgi:hypothetical protein
MLPCWAPYQDDLAVVLARVALLKTVYFAYFHSFMTYGIIFWGNSTNTNKVFLLQNKIIKIVAGA